MQNIIFQPLGDTGVRVQFCEQVSSGLNKKIRSFCLLLKKRAYQRGHRMGSRL